MGVVAGIILSLLAGKIVGWNVPILPTGIKVLARSVRRLFVGASLRASTLRSGRRASILSMPLRSWE